MNYKIPFCNNFSFARARAETHFDLETDDIIEQERQAQLQEHQKRAGQGTKNLNINHKVNLPKHSQQRPFTEKKTKNKSKPLSFEENLKRTFLWLTQAFPHIFEIQGPHKVLDIHILRDIKQHYKHHQEISLKKDQYPENLVIKAALNHYMTSDDYLHKIKEGTKRYNLKGIECELVTQEGEEKALQLLGLIPEQRLRS